MGFPGGSVVKSLPANSGSILAWEIPWSEEPGGLYIVHGVAKESDKISQLNNKKTQYVCCVCKYIYIYTHNTHSYINRRIRAYAKMLAMVISDDRIIDY